MIFLHTNIPSTYLTRQLQRQNSRIICQNILYKIKMLCSYKMEFISLLPIITLNLSWQIVTCSRNRAEQLALRLHPCSMGPPFPGSRARLNSVRIAHHPPALPITAPLTYLQTPFGIFRVSCTSSTTISKSV